MRSALPVILLLGSLTAGAWVGDSWAGAGPPAAEAGEGALHAVEPGLPRFQAVDTSFLMGSPDPLPPLAIEGAFPNLQFDRPLQVTHAGDGSDRLFVCEQAGRIWVFPNRRDVTEAERHLFLDLSDRVATNQSEEGLMSIAFHPNFRENGMVFVYYTVRPLASVVARYRVMEPGANRVDPRTGTTILTFEQPYWNHNGGSMAFGPDGYLYIGLGDGGSGGDPLGHGQNLGTLLGSILRIDVDRRSPGRMYAIPSDNPFVGQGPEVREEIWAYGLRNVWRLSFDRLTGALWAADVGQDAWEEINVIERGGNYGWNLREGTHPFRPELATGEEELTDPIWEYPHSEGKSITGGVVYRGRRFRELFGAYLYADFVTGRVWALRYDGEEVTSNIEIAAPRQLPITSFGEDAAGEVYFTAFDGYVYTFEPAEDEGDTASLPFPRLLSQTELFTSTATMTPVEGLIPYEVNVPLWSDGTEKERYIALPRPASIEFSAEEPWELPVGTVLVKTFLLDRVPGDPSTRRRLETRLLVHNPRGWAGYTYVWNEAQTDARLIDTAVTHPFVVETAEGPQRLDWYFPSRADCNACHTAAAGHALGTHTAQMNRLADYAGGTVNQLEAMERLGMFAAPLPAAEELPAHPDWEDAHADLGAAVRGYLETNCAVCHQPGGPSGTDLDLRAFVPLAATGLVDREPTLRLGGEDLMLLVPGDPHRSELYLRVRARGAGQMPPLATHLPDRVALERLGRWIASLPAEP